MVIEYVANSEKLERKGNEKNVVRRISALNDLKPAGHKDPDRKNEFPEERPTVFPDVPERRVPFLGHWMAKDVHSIQYLVELGILFAARRDHRDFVACVVQGTSLFPDPGVEGHWQILDDDKDFLLHGAFSTGTG